MYKWGYSLCCWGERESVCVCVCVSNGVMEKSWVLQFVVVDEDEDEDSVDDLWLEIET